MFKFRPAPEIKNTIARTIDQEDVTYAHVLLSRSRESFHSDTPTVSNRKNTLSVFLPIPSNNMSFKPQPAGFAIKAIHGGQSPDQWSHGAIVPPLVSSTQFRLRDAASVHDAQAFAYGRVANPTRLVLESCLAGLDGGRHALTYASGSGAVTAIVQLLRPGDHVVGVADMYGGTYGLFEELFAAQGVAMELVDFTDLPAFEGAIRANTKVKYVGEYGEEKW